jgi:creatinine amidohydrolase
MVVDWWLVASNAVTEVYNIKAPMGDHAALEEAALIMTANPELIDKEMYDSLGKENIARANTDAGVAMMPSWTTMFPPAVGVGYLDFDLAKAKTYTQKKADFIADTFLEAVKRWEMMESWKKAK